MPQREDQSPMGQQQEANPRRTCRYRNSDQSRIDDRKFQRCLHILPRDFHKTLLFGDVRKRQHW